MVGGGENGRYQKKKSKRRLCRTDSHLYMYVYSHLITLYPFVYVFSMSVSDPMSVLKQEV